MLVHNFEDSAQLDVCRQGKLIERKGSESLTTIRQLVCNSWYKEVNGTESSPYYWSKMINLVEHDAG